MAIEFTPRLPPTPPPPPENTRWPYERTYRVTGYWTNGDVLSRSESSDRRTIDRVVEARMGSSAAQRITVVDIHSKAILEDWRKTNHNRWRRENESILAKYEA